jgi:hypothetical protein
MKNFLNSDWLRAAVQCSAKKWNTVQKNTMQKVKIIL